MSILEREEPGPSMAAATRHQLQGHRSQAHRRRAHRWRAHRWRGGRRLRDNRHVYWWAESLAVLAFYLVYSAIRNLHHGNATEAFQHARELIDLQRSLGINLEESLQAWALGIRPLIWFSNYFYGSLHFIATGGVMIYLYRRWTNDYPLWRNTLAVTTGLALVGFALFPLMPPRLLPAHCNDRPELECRGVYDYEDTLAEDPAFWSFNSGAVNKISNQYAAMPSVHVAWALWCACALVRRLRHRWAKFLAVLYPPATVTAIVLSANHYILDAAAGVGILGIGYVVARACTRAGRRQNVPEPEPITA